MADEILHRPFRLAMAGSRDLRDSGFVFDKLMHFLSQRYSDVVILHGGCRAADVIADAEALLAFPPHPVFLGTQDATSCAVGTRTPIVIFWLDIDRVGMVREVKKVVSYNRKALKWDVLVYSLSMCREIRRGVRNVDD